MPTLREILDRQKQAKEKSAHGISSSKVLQSQAVPEKTLPKEAKSTEGKIPEKSITVITNQGDFEIPANPMVEQGPPKGLSALQLIKWKREHATNKNVNATARSTAAPSIPQEKQVPQTERPKVSEQVQIVSEQTNTVASNKNANGTIDCTELRRNLEYLANNIEQKELVGQIVRTIAVQLKNNPDLTPYMADADVDLVVRGLRRSYSLVARKKSEAKEAKEAKSKMGGDLAQAFKDAGFDGLGDIFK